MPSEKLELLSVYCFITVNGKPQLPKNNQACVYGSTFENHATKQNELQAEEKRLGNFPTFWLANTHTYKHILYLSKGKVLPFKINFSALDYQ